MNNPKSKCHGQPAIEYGDSHFCGGINGCGKWCEIEDKSPVGKEGWEEEFRQYFDKTLKPKKPTMVNLDRELCIDFIKKLLLTAQDEARREVVEEIRSLFEGEPYLYHEEIEKYAKSKGLSLKEDK